MKILVASDIHGDAQCMGMLCQRIKEDEPDMIVLLGDLLYHGPRNDLPEYYNTKTVAQQLNELRLPIICVRGNCDAEVDQVMVNFPIMSDYSVINDGDRMLYACHGHNMNWTITLPEDKDQVVLTGHIHVPGIWQEENFIRINPGSVSLPRNGTPHSYIFLEGKSVSWRDVLTGQEFQHANLP